MRLGQILLALLAPLVSLTPALKADLAATRKPAAADSLAGLLRAAVPVAAAIAAETGHFSSSHAPSVFPAIFAPYVLAPVVTNWHPAADATLRLLTRQQLRIQLRC